MDSVPKKAFVAKEPPKGQRLGPKGNESGFVVFQPGAAAYFRGAFAPRFSPLFFHASFLRLISKGSLLGRSAGARPVHSPSLFPGLSAG
jgi:hypothetical protein